MKYFERYDANYAELVIGYWAEIGVDVEMSIHGAAEILAIMREHTSDGIAHGENANPATDHLMTLNRFTAQIPAGLNNDGLGVNDPQMDAMIDAAKAATTLEERNSAHQGGESVRGRPALAYRRSRSRPQFNVAQPWVKGYNGELSIGVPGNSQRS